MDKLDSALEKATVLVAKDIDPAEGPIENQEPLVDELVLTFFQLRGMDLSKSDLEQLNEISEYVKSQAKSDDSLDKLQVLRDIRFKLGAPEFGMKRHDQVFQYIKLKQAAKKYTTEAESMEEGA
jgi:hypothetical protein